MKRRAIQITVTQETDARYGELFAICDDGTIWSMTFRGTELDPWVELPPIPQDETNEDPS